MGRTHKYCNTRQYEHFERDKNSAIFKHFQTEPQCKSVNTYDSFSVLDDARTDYELALKEAMHIKWVKPKLNGQKMHIIIKLLI